MKKILLLISIFTLLLLAFCIFVHFNNIGIKIQTPPPPKPQYDPGTDPDFIPINDYLVSLVVVGIAYAFYKIRAMHLPKIT
jgi:hypothetical protein